MMVFLFMLEVWLRGQDLNLRPSGYEPDELPGCSTPRYPGDACVVRPGFCHLAKYRLRKTPLAVYAYCPSKLPAICLVFVGTIITQKAACERPFVSAWAVELVMRRLFYISCVLQTWQRPTLPRLKTKYHGRRGVSRPCSERERVQPPRHNHQVGKAQLYVLRSWQALACFLFLNTSFGPSSGCGCLWHPYRPEAVANRLAGRPQRHWRVRTKVWIIDPDDRFAVAGR